jgi:hypothetical protein
MFPIASHLYLISFAQESQNLIIKVHKMRRAKWETPLYLNFIWVPNFEEDGGKPIKCVFLQTFLKSKMKKKPLNLCAQPDLIGRQ